MKIKKAYKFRLKMTAEIENQFLQFAGCCRKVWNLVLSFCGIIGRFSGHWS